jgi:hypothetical protein
VPGPPDRPSERSDAPVWPDASVRPDASAADGRATWSRDDLRERLRRLPPGHPSSLERTAAVPSGQRLPADDHQHGPDRRVDRTADRPGDRAPDRTITRSVDRTDGEPSPISAPEAARESDAARRDYWSEVPMFLETWAAHERTWPGRRRSVVDRSMDPPGAWRGEGNQYLDPERHAHAKDVIADVQRAEKPITEHMQQVEQANTCGGWLEGLEHCLKGEDRLKEKIADLAETSAPDAPVEYVARQVPDAIRYTFCVEADGYALAYWAVKGQLEERGYSMTYAENHWPREEYKGINTRWLTSEGQRFELQFHTPESFHAKQQVTHFSYERLRNPLTTEAERSKLSMFQRVVCAWIDTPGEADGIPSYREGDR